MATTKVTKGVIADNAVSIDQLDVTDGSNGQVLSTDGSGTLSFTSVTSYTDSDVETYLDGGTSTPTFSSATVTGDATFDTDTLVVDATNDRVGIGTSSPAYQVEIENTGANALLVLDRTDGASTFIEGGASDSVIGSVGSNDVKIAYNSVPVVTIGSGGDITTSGTITYGTLNDGSTALTSTVAELNYLDGVTGITLGSANDLLVVGSDGSSIASDSTLAVDTGNNRLGINQSSPEVTLHMTGEGAQTAQIRMEQYNDSSDAPDIRTRRYRGTIASPSAVQSGDYLFRSNHEYYNGTSLLVGGAFAFDNTNNAARTQFSVAVDTDGTGADPAGTNGQFKIDGNDGGAITFNNAYKFPTSDGTANQVLSTDGSGTLSFADGGVAGIVSSADATAITIDSSERVGIGETSPDESLVVSGGVKIKSTNKLSFSNTSDQTYIHAVGSNLLAFGTNSTERIRIDSSGNVGIGKVPNRSRKLEVAGNINLDNSYGLEWEDGGVGIVGSGATDTMTFSTAGIERMKIHSGGQITASKQPCFMCYPTSSFTASGGSVKYTFASESFDNQNEYNHTTGRFTAPVDGKYLFMAELALQSSVSALTYAGIGVRVNGSGDVYYGGWGYKADGYTNSSGAHYGKINSSVILNLAQGDYIELYIELSGSHTVLGGNSGTYTRLMGHLLTA